MNNADGIVIGILFSFLLNHYDKCLLSKLIQDIGRSISFDTDLKSENCVKRDSQTTGLKSVEVRLCFIAVNKQQEDKKS